VNITKKSIALLSIAIIFSPLALADRGSSAQKSGITFNKMDQTAAFIHGDNLVTDVVAESGLEFSSGTSTPEQRAAGMSAVMVAPNGEMFESVMSKKDAALFEKAIKTLEKAGHSAAIFTNEVFAQMS